MPRIITIVEGHGEVQAVPILLRRLAVEIKPEIYLDVPPPIRVKRQKILKEGELERAVELAARKSEPCDGILILLDADSDCPKELAHSLLDRAIAVNAG